MVMRRKSLILSTLQLGLNEHFIFREFTLLIWSVGCDLQLARDLLKCVSCKYKHYNEDLSLRNG